MMQPSQLSTLSTDHSCDHFYEQHPLFKNLDSPHAPLQPSGSCDTRPHKTVVSGGSCNSHSSSSSEKVRSTSLITNATEKRVLYHASYSKEGTNRSSRRPKVNQDRLFEVACFEDDYGDAIFGAFDGHGEVGHEVSAFCSAEIAKKLSEKHNQLYKNPKEILQNTFNMVSSYLKHCNINCIFSGSTGIVCYLQESRLFTCNVGDSRAVIARAEIDSFVSVDGDETNQLHIRAIPLSNDQTPDRPDERERILNAKGRIAPHKMNGEECGPARVWLPTSDIPGLSMSRSFGDLVVSGFGVISEPELCEYALDKRDRFIILATDGVWNMFTNQEAVEIVFAAIGDSPTEKTIENAVQTLVLKASEKWSSLSPVVDDVSAIIIYLHEDASHV